MKIGLVIHVTNVNKTMNYANVKRQLPVTHLVYGLFSACFLCYIYVKFMRKNK